MSSPAEGRSPLRDPVLRAMLEAGGVWLWDADLVAETSKYQEGFWEQYGYSADQFDETFDFIQVVHTSDLPAISRAWRAHLDGKTPVYTAEWRLRTAAGDWRWIRSHGKVISRDAHGTALRMVGTYSDITDVRRSELGLAESTAEMDAVFRNSRDGICLVSPDMTLLRGNKAAGDIIEKFTGIRILEGDSILDLPEVAEGRPVITDIRLTLAGGRAMPDRLVGDRDGRGWMEAAYSPVFNADGSILGVAVSLRDVTERKRLEQSRLNALRLESMGLLAGGIAHDFNNLLAAIMGNVEVARLGEVDPESRLALDDAFDAATRAAELVRELLAFAGKQVPAITSIDLSTIAAEMARYARKIPGHQARVTEDLAEGLPTLEADATQLRQVALNLVINALEATRATGGAVHVRTFSEPDPPLERAVLEPRPATVYVALEVRDDGVGMDAATLERIWDPFFTTRETGHGLGLASVLGAVRAHGGGIVVESEPGRGSSFTVFLPADG